VIGPGQGQDPADAGEEETVLALRNRRGAVVVLVGVMIVLLMTLGAITIDASRLFATKGELQTAADAAALAGAIELLRRPAEATDSAVAFGKRNIAANAYITDLTATTGVWSATTSSWSPASPLSADAVRVEARQQVGSIFARLLGDTTITMRAYAIAWSSAPVVETNCVKPLAVPFQVIRDILGPSGPTLTDDDFRKLDDLTQNNQDATRFSLKYGQDWVTDTTSAGARDRYYAIDMPPTWLGATGSAQSVPGDPGSDAFKTNVEKCSKSQISIGDSVRTVPGGNRVDKMIDGLPAFCADYVSNACFSSFGGPGVMAKAVFYDGDPAWDGSGLQGSLGVKMVGSFAIDSVISSGPNKGRIAARLRTMRDYGKIGKTATSLRRPVLVQ
jgi:Flp pilus assembly protein TadG